MASIGHLVVMSGRPDVASRLAKYWREERMARPDNILLQFVGAAVDPEVPLRSKDDLGPGSESNLPSGGQSLTPLGKFAGSTARPLCKALGANRTYQVAANLERRLVSSRGEPLDHCARPWERIELTKWRPILDAAW